MAFSCTLSATVLIQKLLPVCVYIYVCVSWRLVYNSCERSCETQGFWESCLTDVPVLLRVYETLSSLEHLLGFTLMEDVRHLDPSASAASPDDGI